MIMSPSKAEMIKWFDEDQENPKLKAYISNLVANLNKDSANQVYAGVEVSSFYVIDSEYHIYCGRTHLVVRKEHQDPWLSDYYVVSKGHKKSNCYNMKQIETAVKELLGENLCHKTEGC